MENKPEVIDLTGDSPPCSPARMNQGEWDRVNNKFIEMIKLSSTSPTFCETETPRKNNRTYRDPPGFKLALGDDKHFLDDISEEMDADAETPPEMTHRNRPPSPHFGQAFHPPPTRPLKRTKTFKSLPKEDLEPTSDSDSDDAILAPVMKFHPKATYGKDMAPEFNSPPGPKATYKDTTTAMAAEFNSQDMTPEFKSPLPRWPARFSKAPPLTKKKTKISELFPLKPGTVKPKQLRRGTPPLAPKIRPVPRDLTHIEVLKLARSDEEMMKEI
mgnify:FL=1